MSNYMKKLNQGFYYYKGSLTTPECDEVVNWLILQDVQPCSTKQLELMKTYLKNNFRHLNPLNGRKVYANKPIYTMFTLDKAWNEPCWLDSHDT